MLYMAGVKLTRKRHLVLLTCRTNVCAAAGGADFDDGGVGMTRAGLAFAAEDLGEREVTAALAFMVDVISVCKAAFFYGQAEDVAQFGVKCLKLGLRYVHDARQRMDFGRPQRLIGVNVTDAGDDRLVKQYGLDAALGAAHESRYEIVRRKRVGQRLGPDFLKEIQLFHLDRWQ